MNYEIEFRAWVANKLPDGFISEKVMELVSLIVVWVSDNFSASATIAAISGAVGSIINFVIGLIISIYLLKDKEVFINIWKKFLQRTNTRIKILLTGHNERMKLIFVKIVVRKFRKKPVQKAGIFLFMGKEQFTCKCLERRRAYAYEPFFWQVRYERRLEFFVGNVLHF